MSIYLLKLGEYVHAFAQAEASLNLVFHRVAKVPADIGNILKGEMPLSKLAQLSKVLARENDFPAQVAEEIESLAGQLLEIAKLRNKILHQGALPHGTKPDTFVWHNAAVAQGMRGYREAEFTLDDLDAATTDLRAIGLRLLALASPQDVPLNPAIRPLLLAPWRYKHAAPTSPNPPTLHALRPPSSRPEASAD